MPVRLIDWLTKENSSWGVWIHDGYVIALYDSHYTLWSRSIEKPILQGLTREQMTKHYAMTSLRADSLGETYGTEW